MSEPYRSLFILGLFFSILGVGQWIVFDLNLISNYPVRTHSELMVLGFLLCFVSGFLMTAVPRMTGTEPASKVEKAAMIFAFLIFMALSLLGLHEAALISCLAIFISLIAYFVRRKMKMRGRNLPTGFLFIPLGLLTGLGATALLLLSYKVRPDLLGFSKILLYEGFILNLVVGLGSRLIPMLTRKNAALSPVDVNEISGGVFLLQALALNGSFVMEEFVNQRLGLILRFAVLAVVVHKNFRLFKPIAQRSNLGVGISVAAAALPLCYLSILLFPVYRMHLIHIVYIIGFALLAFLISVRVSLAHGGSSVELERTSKSIFVLTGAFVIAGAIRALGPILAGAHVLTFYALAGSIFLLGVAAWGLFLRKVLFLGAEHVEKT